MVLVVPSFKGTGRPARAGRDGGMAGHGAGKTRWAVGTRLARWIGRLHVMASARRTSRSAARIYFSAMLALGGLTPQEVVDKLFPLPSSKHLEPKVE